jgi:thiamine pyrophosphate-dependent acetolactate synthase large subunit-like protein
VATSRYAAGFCAQYPLYLGICGGLGSKLTVETLAESDVMVVVGASLNEWTTDFRKILQNGKKVIQIDLRPEAFGWFARVDVGLEGDAKPAVRRLLQRLKNEAKPRQPAAATAQKIKDRKA